MSIEELETKLSEISPLIRKFAESLKFTAVCEFKIEEWDNLISKPKFEKGLYFIEIKNDKRFNNFNNWIIDFTDKYEQKDEEGEHIFKYRFVPNLIKKRIKAQKEFGEWIPMYIGKSMNITDRVNQHVNIELEKNTFALKLKARTLLHDQTFRLNIIEINSKHYDLVVPRIESYFREKLNPIIGKQ
jgi:hypothetical protein